MSLYGYDLAQYVVGTSLGMQPVVRIVLELNPSGWRCVGLVVANTHKAQEGALGGLVVANTSSEWPDLSMRGDKFDLNWRDVHGPTTTFQG
jgi:hypothetical protein